MNSSDDINFVSWSNYKESKDLITDIDYRTDSETVLYINSEIYWFYIILELIENIKSTIHYLFTSQLKTSLLPTISPDLIIIQTNPQLLFQHHFNSS